jgi:hypothetical protein
MLALYCTSACLTVIGAMLVFLARRLFRKPVPSDCSWTWIEVHPARRYDPMLNLLSEDDFSFLKSQPGYDPGVCRCLRRERRRLFRGYLHSLRRDFNGITRALHALALQSAQDESHLLLSVFRASWQFSLRLWALELRYVCFVLGLSKVDARPLIAAADSLCSTVHRLARVTLGADCSVAWAASV